jgi:hypothetical protein
MSPTWGAHELRLTGAHVRLQSVGRDVLQLITISDLKHFLSAAHNFKWSLILLRKKGACRPKPHVHEFGSTQLLQGLRATSAYDLARSGILTGSGTGGGVLPGVLSSALTNNSPGNFKHAPNTTSAAEVPQSSLGAARSPNMVQGRWSNQADPHCLARRLSFICLCRRSTIPFAWGWYAIVVMWLKPS